MVKSKNLLLILPLLLCRVGNNSNIYALKHIIYKYVQVPTRDLEILKLIRFSWILDYFILGNMISELKIV